MKVSAFADALTLNSESLAVEQVRAFVDRRVPAFRAFQFDALRGNFGLRWG